jgi:hypothetical protein
MSHATRLLPVAFLASLLVAASCFIFVDNPGATSASSTGTGGSRDAGDSEGDGGDEETPICDLYGGYQGVETIVGDVMAKVTSDCHISAFFAHLTPDQLQHLGDCLTKQVAFLMRCDGIKYDVDSNGADCRGMKASHHGLGIRSMDFDAFVGDVFDTLEADMVSADDVAALKPALEYLRVDVVTNSAPGYTKDTCPDGG